MSYHPRRQKQQSYSYAAAAASGTSESGRYDAVNRSSLSAATATATGLNRGNRRRSADDDPYNFDIEDDEDHSKKKKKQKKKKSKRQSTSGLEKVKAQLQEQGLGRFGDQNKSTEGSSRASSDGLTLEERVQKRLESLSSQREKTLSTMAPEATEGSNADANEVVVAGDSENGGVQQGSPSYPYSPGSDSFSISESDFQSQTTNKERLRADIMSKWQKSKVDPAHGQGANQTLPEDDVEESGSRESHKPHEHSSTKDQEQQLTDSGMLRAELGMGEASSYKNVSASEPMSFSYGGEHANVSPQISSFTTAITKGEATEGSSTEPLCASATTSKPTTRENDENTESSNGYSDDFDRSDGAPEDNTEDHGSKPNESELTSQSQTSLRSSQSPPPPPSSPEKFRVETEATVSGAGFTGVTSDAASAPITRSVASRSEDVTHNTETSTLGGNETSHGSEAIRERFTQSPRAAHLQQSRFNSLAPTSAVQRTTTTSAIDTRRAPPPGDVAAVPRVETDSHGDTNSKTYTQQLSGGDSQTGAFSTTSTPSSVTPVHYNSRNVANEALFASLQAAHLVPPGKIRMDDTTNSLWKPPGDRRTSTGSGVDHKPADSATNHLEATIKQYEEESRQKSNIIASLQSQIQALETQMSNMGQQLWQDQQMRSENYRYESLLASMREIIQGSFEGPDEEKLEQVLGELTDELKVLETLMQGYQKENERLQHRFKTEINRANALARQLDQRAAIHPDHDFNHSSQEENESKADVANRLSRELDAAKREEKLREQIEKLMGEKDSLETKVQSLERQKKDIEGEFQALQQSKIEEESTEIKRLKSEISYLKASNDRTVQALQAKLDWYRENQTLLDSDYNELQRLRKRVRELETVNSEKSQSESSKESQLRKRVSQLEKALKTAEDSLQKRNPDSVANLVREAQTDADSPLGQKVKELNDKLESERKAREEEKEENSRQLRSLRQEHDKMTSKLKKKNSELSESLRKAEDRLQKHEADPAGKDSKKGTKKGSWQQRALDAEAEVKKVREFYQNKIKKLQEKGSKSKSKSKSVSDEGATNAEQTRAQAGTGRDSDVAEVRKTDISQPSQEPEKTNNDSEQVGNVEGDDVQQQSVVAPPDSGAQGNEETSLASFKRYVAERSSEEKGITMLTQQINNLTEKCNHLEQERDNYQREVNEMHNQLSAIKGENGILRRQNDSLLQRLETSSANSSKDNLRRAIADLEAKLEEREKKTGACRRGPAPRSCGGSGKSEAGI
eukprot:gb/GECG01001885.1/.p1 GENE.gb/GECG01001885.1/~~gb/GECG01001885.1/.p1  ORF type:complete len:1257 (+),score=270.48 gb/GECG01001885.1/:1-3771(+)